MVTRMATQIGYSNGYRNRELMNLMEHSLADSGVLPTAVTYRQWCPTDSGVLPTVVTSQHWCLTDSGDLPTLVSYQHWCPTNSGERTSVMKTSFTSISWFIEHSYICFAPWIMHHIGRCNRSLWLCYNHSCLIAYYPKPYRCISRG